MTLLACCASLHAHAPPDKFPCQPLWSLRKGLLTALLTAQHHAPLQASRTLHPSFQSSPAPPTPLIFLSCSCPPRHADEGDGSDPDPESEAPSYAYVYTYWLFYPFNGCSNQLMATRFAGRHQGAEYFICPLGVHEGGWRCGAAVKAV